MTLTTASYLGMEPSLMWWMDPLGHHLQDFHQDSSLIIKSSEIYKIQRQALISLKDLNPLLPDLFPLILTTRTHCQPITLNLPHWPLNSDFYLPVKFKPVSQASFIPEIYPLLFVWVISYPISCCFMRPRNVPPRGVHTNWRNETCDFKWPNQIPISASSVETKKATSDAGGDCWDRLILGNSSGSQLKNQRER